MRGEGEWPCKSTVDTESSNYSKKKSPAVNPCRPQVLNRCRWAERKWGTPLPQKQPRRSSEHSPRHLKGITMWFLHCFLSLRHQLSTPTGWLASITLVICSSGYICTGEEHTHHKLTWSVTSGHSLASQDECLFSQHHCYPSTNPQLHSAAPGSR